MIRQRLTTVLRCLAAGAVLAVLAGGTTAAAAPPAATGVPAPPQVHGPEKTTTGARAALAGSRPKSGTAPSAGPQFKKVGSTWRVIAPEAVLQNTVTDADGDKSTLTFEVWTAKADGTPDKKVKLTDANPYGVLVSPYTASGATAKMQVDYGILKPRTDYLFHTNAFDGSLYETTWSPWAKFRIEPYVMFPSGMTDAPIDSTEQQTIEFTRTDPDGSATPSAAAPAAKSATPSAPASAEEEPKLSDFDRQDCSKVDGSGRTVCFTLSKADAPKEPEAPAPGKSRKTAVDLDGDDGAPAARKAAKGAAGAAAAAGTPGGNEAVDLVKWCTDAPEGKDYMNRTEACLKTLGEGELWFFDADPKKPAIGKGNFLFEQRIKTYRNKSESQSDFAEFDQQLVIIPTFIDQALEGVTMTWDVDSSCSACDVAPVQWTDDGANPIPAANWDYDAAQDYRGAWGTVVTRWLGTGKETIDLEWKITATVDASDSVDATADFGSSGIPAVQELAPRCDDISRGSVTPGCVLPYFKPTFTVDTNSYPSAGGYYWLMQEMMPDHAGSVKWDSLVHYLGTDTKVKNGSGQPWSTTDSRKVVCPTTWTKHPADPVIPATDCDEYAPASTHESGGFPGGVNQVTNGDQCAQLYTDWSFNGVGDGSTSFGLFADIRKATKGPQGTERCGRAAINASENQGAFHKLQPQLWRLTDGDGFFIDTPGFNHCTGVAATCQWKKK